jgi:hypothetical protein
VLLVAGAAVTAFALTRNGAPAARPDRGHAPVSQKLAAEAATRAQAITWILHQVSPAAVVACDPLVCTDLINRGFPNVSPLGPQSNDPLGSNLVVATASVRAQYRNRLAAVWAPAVIASFGSGIASIQIRLEYPGGAAAYDAVAVKALRDRKAADAQLLANHRITLSATAGKQLRSGVIDPRLPLLIATMAHFHPVRIVDFGGQTPGGGPASLVRWVDLATADRATHLVPGSYLRWMQGFVKVQRTVFRPDWSHTDTLPTGQAVLRIGYGAPSPLGPCPSPDNPFFLC